MYFFRFWIFTCVSVHGTAWVRTVTDSHKTCLTLFWLLWALVHSKKINILLKPIGSSTIFLFIRFLYDFICMLITTPPRFFLTDQNFEILLRFFVAAALPRDEKKIFVVNLVLLYIFRSSSLCWSQISYFYQELIEE
jgi:hypothetical protein